MGGGAAVGEMPAGGGAAGGGAAADGGGEGGLGTSGEAAGEEGLESGSGDPGGRGISHQGIVGRPSSWFLGGVPAAMLLGSSFRSVLQNFKV